MLLLTSAMFTTQVGNAAPSKTELTQLENPSKMAMTQPAFEQVQIVAVNYEAQTFILTTDVASKANSLEVKNETACVTYASRKIEKIIVSPKGKKTIRFL